MSDNVVHIHPDAWRDDGPKRGWLVTIELCRWCGNRQVVVHPAVMRWPSQCARCSGQTCVPDPEK